MRRFGSEYGFSLVELIITIAILGLLSGILMKFFVISATGETIASEKNQALTIGNQMVEQFKYIGTLDDYFNTINNGTWVTREIVTNAENLRAYFDSNWSYVATAGEARYQMDIAIAYPSQVTTGVGAVSGDFDVTFDTSGTIQLIVDDAGTTYTLLASGLPNQTMAIPVEDVSTLTLTLNLTGSGLGSVNIQNDLSTAESSLAYDEIRDDILRVAVYRNADNESAIDTEGNVNLTDYGVYDSSASGVYTITVTMSDRKSGETIGVYTGSKYGGVE
ncbi:type II secretion system protein [Fusibacter paucivorans]|uniref:Type II secretion system protein n=1 Tax=Fusibacter paucivorans TaxID=76009 RepID=A0ABS5PUZ2_9FIRM|nr:type II secretion system protein [Fusibacter paucivorans]MBS7527882.1 type II secretion system protein [Fusibacter paucivorans]